MPQKTQARTCANPPRELDPLPIGFQTRVDFYPQIPLSSHLTIYETVFPGFSYGFRPERSPHQALDALSVGITRKKVNWMLAVSYTHLTLPTN